jgi:hypothetical protein
MLSGIHEDRKLPVGYQRAIGCDLRNLECGADGEQYGSRRRTWANNSNGATRRTPLRDVLFRWTSLAAGDHGSDQIFAVANTCKQHATNMREHQ